MVNSKVIFFAALLITIGTLAITSPFHVFKRSAGFIKPIRLAESTFHPPLGAGLSPEILYVLKLVPYSQEKVTALFISLQKSTDPVISQLVKLGLDKIFTFGNSFFTPNVPVYKHTLLKRDLKNFGNRIAPTELNPRFINEIESGSYNYVARKYLTDESFVAGRKMQCLLYAGYLRTPADNSLSVAIQTLCVDLRKVTYVLPLSLEAIRLMNELITYKIMHG